MSYRYLALLDIGGRLGRPASDVAAKLREMGMRDRLTFGPLELFISPETPWLRLPDGGIIIGHLFSQDGSPAQEALRHSKYSCPTQLRKFITENIWGDYLLIQPERGGVESVTVVRDPSGGTPCVYSLRQGLGFITSDISLAISAHLYRKKVDWDAIARCVVYPNLKAGRTGLADVYELLPGCSLRVHETEITTEQHWSPWNLVASENRHEDLNQAAASIRHAVMSSVRAWANTDKSVLLELSGGLDSSIVAACLKTTGSQVTCCNLVTPIPGTDERRYAKQMADYLGVELQVEEIDFEQARFDFVPSSSAVAPRIGILQHAISTAMEAAGHRHGVSSFISGAGGDTVFCYLTTAAPATDALKERGLAVGISAIHDLSTLHQCTFWKAGRLTLKKLARPARSPCKPDNTFIHPSHASVAAEHHPWFDAPEGAFPGDRERIFDLARTQVFRDIVPRGAGGWVRMPLLSQPVVEACLRTPSWMWILGGRNRSVARSAFSDTLPTDILNRKSKGSFVGYLGAVFRRNKSQIREMLLSGALREQNLLDTAALIRFFESELPPRDKQFMRILALCMTENWVRHQS